jgi:hypothetical protein
LPVPVGDDLERTLTFVGGSPAKKWLKSRLTSEYRAPRGSWSPARAAGDVPYGRGLRYRGSPTDSSGGTDLSRLANELGASTSNQPPNGEPFEDDDEEEDDPYAQYADLYNDDGEDEDDESGPQSQRRGA